MMQKTKGFLFLSMLIMHSGCETTDDSFGYIASGLNWQSVQDLITISDQSVNNRDYITYASLFSPRFSLQDKSPEFGMSDIYQNRYEFLENARDTLSRAKEISISTTITETEFDEQTNIVLVTVQEDQILNYQGKNKRAVSLVEYEVAYEEGWIFFNHKKVIAKNEI